MGNDYEPGRMTRLRSAYQSKVNRAKEEQMPKMSNLKSRLQNWKFSDARKLMDPNDPGFDLVCSLSNMFGNSGWLCGDMYTVVEAALESIGIRPIGEEDDQPNDQPTEAGQNPPPSANPQDNQ